MNAQQRSERLDGGAERRPSRPNLVMIVADDLGYGDVGCYNPASRIPTPNIDALADRGIRFLDAHAPAAICTPSRYGLLTGRYGWRSALPRAVLYGYEPPLIEPSRPTIASWLRNVGYHTAAIGKWHLGLQFEVREGTRHDWGRPLPWPESTPELERRIDFTAGVSGGPTALGFEYFFGTSGCPTCQPPFAFIENEHFTDIPSIYCSTPPFTGRSGLCTPNWRHSEADIEFTTRAVKYIRERSDGDQPFLLYLASDAPHEPCVTEVVPAFARGTSEAGPRGDLVWLFDWMVGEVVKALAETGLLEDTLVIVTSDHGALPGDRVSAETGGEPAGIAAYRTYGHSSCGPWRGYKAHIWEGGHRVPFVAAWPNQIPAGKTSGALICHTDLIATLAHILDLPLPVRAAEDSETFASALLGIHGESHSRTEIVLHSQMGAFAIRVGGLKCVFGTEGSGGWPPPPDGLPDPIVFDPAFPTARAFAEHRQGQLYDLASDPAEQANLWTERFDVVLDMAARLHECRTRLTAGDPP